MTSSKSCEMQSLVTIEHLVRTAPSKECETIGRVSIYRKKIKKINCASFSDQRRSKLLNRSREASAVTETYHLSLLAPRSLFRCIQTFHHRRMLRAWRCCGVATGRHRPISQRVERDIARESPLCVSSHIYFAYIPAHAIRVGALGVVFSSTEST